jgi:hypothetical protein
LCLFVLQYVQNYSGKGREVRNKADLRR